MGQKVNPHGIRVGVIKDWDSRWFASKKDFSDTLVEDHKIRTELKAQLKDAGVPKIEIERTVDSTSAPRVNVNIYCAKPGMVIGKGGEERIALQNKLTKEYGKTVIVNVIEVKSPSTNAQLVAEDIARQLENRVTFRRAMKQCIRNAMSPAIAQPFPQRASRQCAPAVWAALISPAPRATTRAPSPCRPCVPTSTTALQRLLPPTAASALRCGSTRARSSRAQRPLLRRKEATSNVTA